MQSEPDCRVRLLRIIIIVKILLVNFAAAYAKYLNVKKRIFN